MSASTETGGPAGEAFEALLRDLRPKLHRYCTRMVGSAIDGEDVLQDALVKAVAASPTMAPLANPEGWLFRIAHNAALDFLRRRRRVEAVLVEEALEDIADESDETARRELAAMSVRAFMTLSPAERSSVVLMDVLGHSLREIGEINGMTVPAVKAALHRGRARLSDMAASEDGGTVVRAPADVRQLQRYIDRFNARDFDGVRDMLAEDVRLELVGRTRLKGKGAVSTYFGRYAERPQWWLALGLVDGRLALLGLDRADLLQRPSFFILLEWVEGKVAAIRDFHHAPYVADEASIERLPPATSPRP